MQQYLLEQIQRQVLAHGSLMHRWVGPIVLTVAVGVAYFLAARLSISPMTQPGVAVFWPAAGVASGTVIAFGRAAWFVAAGLIRPGTVLAGLKNNGLGPRSNVEIAPANRAGAPFRCAKERAPRTALMNR